MIFSYLLLRLVTLPFGFLPLPVIHCLGRRLGSLFYYLLPEFRKIAQSNLALADGIAPTNVQVRLSAKRSIQNVIITGLEYSKLLYSKSVQNVGRWENPQEAESLISSGQGVIIFWGHQANWEIMLFELTKRFSGMVMARSLKNRYLNDKIQSIRLQFGGRIVPPKKALQEGLRSLRQGEFCGIVGDQGVPSGGHYSDFLGRKAWTSRLPALLAYRTGCPILVANWWRSRGRYSGRSSPPIYPNTQAPMREEVARLMNEILKTFEQSVRANPGDWFWIHNRWKQQTLDVISKGFRHDAMAIVLPESPKLAEGVGRFREVYPTEHITVFVPHTLADRVEIDAEVIPYKELTEALRQDYRFKMLFNFTGSPKVSRHYKRLAVLNVHAFETIDDALRAVRYS